MPTFNIDGHLVSPDQACISVMDHGLLYGDGVFEGLRFYNGVVFRCTDHLDRLRDSALAIGLTLPMTFEAMHNAMNRTIEASGQTNGYIRLIVTRGEGPLGIDSSLCQNPRTIIIIDKLALVSPEIVRNGVKIVIASTRRLNADQLDPRIKSLNYLNNIMARREASSAGADEAIMLNQWGRIAEGSADNIFVVKNNIIKTPPISEGALDGITRKVIIEIAEQLRLQIEQVPLTTLDLYAADECFLTGTGAELIPVASIGNHNLPEDKPMFNKLSEAFQEEVRTIQVEHSNSI